MEHKIIFYPMSQQPEADEKNSAFSKTVLVYGDENNFVELGYYDFESRQWSHLGEDSFMLKCWSYLPNPSDILKNAAWQPVRHKGYSDF